jgi:hypothetical protein
MYRGRLLLLTAAVAVTACAEDDADGLDQYDRQPSVTHAPSGQFDAGYEIVVRRDARVRADAAVDAAEPDAAADAAAPDASPDAAAPDGGPGAVCVRAADCALAVRLRTCDSCPVATSYVEVREDECVEEWFPEATIFSYGRDACIDGCVGGATPCLAPPAGVECLQGRCVVVR